MQRPGPVGGFGDVAASWLVGVTGAPVSVLRRGRSWLVSGGGWVVRARPPEDAAAAEAEVAVGEVLAAAGVPAVRLSGPRPQPVVVPGAVLTVWADVPHRSRPVGAATLGRLARRLHDATRPPPPVAPFDLFAAVDAQLGLAREVGASAPPELARLEEAAGALGEVWGEVAPGDPLGTVLVHGDLHAGNVLVGPAGPVLADLELAGVGPASYDLVPTIVAARRYGRSGREVERLVGGYGADPRPWPGTDVLCRGYELWVTAWAVAHRQLSVRHEREAQVRVATLDDPGAGSHWTLL